VRRTDSRWATSIAIAAISNPALTTTTTAITSLVITPVLEVLLLVAVSASVGSPDMRDTAYAGILLAFGLTVLGGTVEQVTRDRRLGVLHEVIGYGIANPSYWAGKLAVPTTLGTAPALVAAVVVFWLDGSHDADALARVLLLIPLAAISGGLVGLTAAIASLSLSDPYVISNSAHSILLITAGVVLPLSLYPQWLEWVALALPFTAAVDAVRGGRSIAPLIVRELAVCVAWFGVSILLGRRVLAAVRSGRAREEVW
jgi:ABC-2 type transport system permease protein